MHFSGLPFRNSSTVTVVEFTTVAVTPPPALTMTELILFNLTITVEYQGTRSAINSTAIRTSNVPSSYTTSLSTIPLSSGTSMFSATGPPSTASSIATTFSSSVTPSAPSATSELVNKQSALATDLSLGIALAAATALAGFIIYFITRSVRQARRLSAIRDQRAKIIPQTSVSYSQARDADLDIESAVHPNLVRELIPDEVAVGQALQARNREQDREQDFENAMGASFRVYETACPAVFASVESLGFLEEDSEQEEGEERVSMATATHITRVIQGPRSTISSGMEM